MDLCTAKDKYTGKVVSLGQKKKRKRRGEKKKRELKKKGRTGEMEIKRGREEKRGGGIWLVQPGDLDQDATVFQQIQ